MEFRGAIFGGLLNQWEGWSWVEPAGFCHWNCLLRRLELPLSALGPRLLPITARTPAQPQKIICNSFVPSSFSLKFQSPGLEWPGPTPTLWFQECGRKHWALFFFLRVKKNYFYYCSITVVPISSPLLSPALPIRHLPYSFLAPLSRCLCPWVLYTCSLMTLLLLSPVISLPPSLWLLSVCSLFPCLGLYFVCLFCWLGSNYKWDPVVFVPHHLAYFT